MADRVGDTAGAPERRLALGRRYPGWAVAVVAAGGAVGTTAWVLGRMPPPAAPSLTAPRAGPPAPSAAGLRLQRQLAADARTIAGLSAGGGTSATVALPARPAPSTHTTTGASGVP